jgi:capsular polysaccharide biosynthesis protein
MELKAYLQIIRRRWPAVVVLPLIVGLLAVWQETTRDATYSTEVRAAVVRVRDPLPTNEYGFDDYYNYVSSEFAIDDLVEAVRGNVFAQAVAERVKATGTTIDAGEVQSMVAADRVHRIISVHVTSHDPDRARAVADAASAELDTNAYSYIGVESDAEGSSVNIIQRPGNPNPDTARERLLLALEVLAALGFGVLLAFLVDYIDDTLYDAESTTAALRLPHLASVPAERQR